MDATCNVIILVDVADYVEFHKAEKFEGKAYSAEQVAALLDAIEQECEPIRAAVTLAVCYGMRREEICRLRWKDIDFETRESLCLAGRKGSLSQLHHPPHQKGYGEV